MWQAQDPEFRKFVLRPIAQELAGKLWTVIMPQLLVLGLPSMTPQEAAELHQRRTTSFIKMFEEALVLKARIKAASCFYFPVWIENGAEFVRGHMQDLEERTGPREVRWCVSPQFTFRDKLGGECRPFVRAKVFTRNLSA